MRQMEHHAIAIAGEVWMRAGENDEINEKTLTTKLRIMCFYWFLFWMGLTRLGLVAASASPCGMTPLRYVSLTKNTDDSDTHHGRLLEVLVYILPPLCYAMSRDMTSLRHHNRSIVLKINYIKKY